MPEKVAIIADPGIDTAFAISLALFDPSLDVQLLGASAGNVSAEQATKNVHVLIEQTDPPRWPKLGAALPVDYDLNGTKLHGPDGLGGVGFTCSQLHNIHPSDRLLVDLVRLYPKEMTVICLGPLTVLDAALERDPELPLLVKRFICLGGTMHEPGNAGPVSEFHFACDPRAAQRVLRCSAPITLIPLDVMRAVLFSPSDLLELPQPESRTCQFLKSIVPFAIGTTSNLYGIEGFHLKDVLGIVAVSLPQALTTKPMAVDVEIMGELTRGMIVIDRRPGRNPRPNVEMALKVDLQEVRNYIEQTLKRTV
jgi:inosine-uridine nucleoside N-ribohydrolase